MGIHSLTDEQLGCFQFGDSIINSAMNISQDSLCGWIHNSRVVVSLWQIDI